MTILILSRAPAFLFDFQEWLKESKEEIVIFTNDLYENSYRNAGYKNVKGFKDYNVNFLVEYEALLIHQANPINNIIALDEKDLIRAAKLRENFDIDGQNLESAISFRDKYVMKNLARQAGILSPPYEVVTSIMQVLKFINTFSYPIIIKPRLGMAAENVMILHNELELLENYSTDLENGNYLIEKFASGDMYTIDGLIVNHKLKFNAVFKYINGCLCYREETGFLAHIISPEEKIHQDLTEFADNLISKLPSPAVSSFHCEVFVQNDVILLCEIASRTAGARMDECIKETYGIDLNEAWVKESLKLPYNYKIHKKESLAGVYLIPYKVGKIKKMADKPPFDWVTEYIPRAKDNYKIKESMKNSASTIGSVVFTGNNAYTLEKRSKQLIDYFNQNMIWK